MLAATGQRKPLPPLPSHDGIYTAATGKMIQALRLTKSEPSDASPASIEAGCPEESASCDVDHRVEEDSMGDSKDLVLENHTLREEITELRRAFVDNLRGKKRLMSGGQFRSIVQLQRHASPLGNATATAAPATPGAGFLSSRGSGSSAGSVCSGSTERVLLDHDAEAPIRLVHQERDLQVAQGLVQALQKKLDAARVDQARSKTIEDASRVKIERQANMLTLMHQRIAHDTSEAGRLRDQLKAKTDQLKRLQNELEREKKKLEQERLKPRKQSGSNTTSRQQPWTPHDGQQADDEASSRAETTTPEQPAAGASGDQQRGSPNPTVQAGSAKTIAIARPRTGRALQKCRSADATLHRPGTAPRLSTSASGFLGAKKNKRAKGPKKKADAAAVPPGDGETVADLDVHAEYLQIMLRRAEEKATAESKQAEQAAQTVSKRDAELAQLRKRFATVLMRVQELTAKVAHAEKCEMGNLKRATQLEHRVRDLESKAVKDEEMIRQFEKEVYDLHGRLERALQEARAAEMQTEALGRDCEDSQARHRTLVEEVNRWKTKSESLDSVCAELLENKAALARALSEKEDLAAIVQETTSARVQDRFVVQDAQKRNSDLEHQLDEMRQMYADLRAEHTQVREIVGLDANGGSLRNALREKLGSYEREIAKERRRRPPAPRIALHVVSPTVNVTLVKGHDVLPDKKSGGPSKRAHDHNRDTRVQCRVKADREAVKRCIEDAVLPKFLKMHLDTAATESGNRAPKEWLSEVTSSLQQAVEGSLTRLYDKCE